MNLDLIYLRKALAQAKIRRGFCAPNPSVGAVLGNSQGKTLATGYHFGAGFPHAEINALNKLNNFASDVTLYVTLEPCCHFGRTPPCTDALIRSGIKRVVYGHSDPNPLVQGKGKQALRNAGISCEYLALPEIKKFYAAYDYWHKTKMPWITGKIAMSLDGKIAKKNGAPTQITGEALQKLTHHGRKKSDALLTTSKTIIADNPQFNVRYKNKIISKPIYILDGCLKLPENAKIFSTAKSITVFHAETVELKRIKNLTQLGVRCISVPSDESGLDLYYVLKEIGKDGVHDLWVEAGGKCFSAFLIKKLFHRALIYMAPKLLGEGIPAFNQDGLLNVEVQSIKSRILENDIYLDLIFND